MRYHDFHLRGYSVSEGGSRIALQLAFDYPGRPKEESHIEFSGVACSHLAYTTAAILTEITEVPLTAFIKQHETLLSNLANRQGLNHWTSNASQFRQSLEDEGLRAWQLDSAVGFSGFIIARAVKQQEEPNQPDAVNGGTALLFQLERPWPAVTDPERSPS